MIEAAFIFTAAMLILTLVRIIGIWCGNSVSLPNLIYDIDSSPAHALILYPSTLFQVWFWANYVGLF